MSSGGGGVAPLDSPKLVKRHARFSFGPPAFLRIDDSRRLFPLPGPYSSGSFTNGGAAEKIGSVRAVPWSLRVSSRNGVQACRTAAFLLRNAAAPDRNVPALLRNGAPLPCFTAFLYRNAPSLSRNAPFLGSAVPFPDSATPFLPGNVAFLNCLSALLSGAVAILLCFAAFLSGITPFLGSAGMFPSRNAASHEGSLSAPQPFSPLFPAPEQTNNPMEETKWPTPKQW